MRSLKGKRKKSIVVIAVVLLLAGALAGWFIIDKRSTVSEEDIDQLTSQVETLQNNKEYEKIETTIKEYLAAHPKLDPKYKYDLLYILAGNYINLKDFKSALSTYQEAEKTNPDGLNYLTALGIAQTAQAIGDNKLAIEYYKKTIELAKTSDNTVYSTFIPQYEKTIKILENPDDVSLQTGDAPDGYPLDGNFPQAPR